MNKKWELYNSNEKLIEEVVITYNIPKLLATVLVNREIVNNENVDVFLNPTRKDFHNPFDMPDMRKSSRQNHESNRESGKSYYIW